MRVQISVVDSNNQTQISVADRVKGQPALKHVAKAGQRITLTVDGVVLTGAQVLENKKIQLVKVGKNLVVETIDGEEKYIEIIDFYSEQGVELTGEAWSYSDESQLIKLDGGVTADGSEWLDVAWHSGAVVGWGGAGLGMGIGGFATVGVIAGLASDASEESTQENKGSASKGLNAISDAAQANNAGAASPAVADYAAAGVSGVTSSNLGGINSLLNDPDITGQSVDTPAEIQALVDSYNKIVDLADGVAGNGTTTPTAGDYTTLGINGIDTPAEVSLLGTVLDKKTGTAVDSADELQELADAVAAVINTAAGI